MARAALVAALGLACGCSTPSSCSSCPGQSFTSRLTGLFRHSGSAEVVGAPIDGPVIADPGSFSGGYPGTYPGGFPGTFHGEGPGCSPLPQSYAPPLAPPPRPLSSDEARRMPYQP
jgi:hypothetical protein